MRAAPTALDPFAFGLAAGSVAAALFVLCALSVALAPDLATAVVSYMLHLDLTGLARPLTWGSFFGGLFCWALGMGVVVAAGAVLYNRFRGAGTLGAETGPS